jgi:hypothetical protein
VLISEQDVTNAYIAGRYDGRHDTGVVASLRSLGLTRADVRRSAKALSLLLKKLEREAVSDPASAALLGDVRQTHQNMVRLAERLDLEYV